MPNEIRLMPPARSRSRSARDTLSGLASVVTSAPGTSPNSFPIAATTATRSSGGRVGVPPPKKTVETGRSRSPSIRRARRTSATAAWAYVVRDAPGAVALPPTSSAV